MQNFLKGKLGTILILVTTVVLAGVAIFTAVRLYQLRSQPVAPNVPSSFPKAQEVASTCNLAFNLTLTTSSPTPTPTPTPTATPSSTPTPTPVPLCDSVCTTNSQCPANLTCSNGNCRNPSCLSDSDCICATATPSPTPTPTATPNACNGTCGSNTNCASNLVCYNGFCRNPSCTANANCICTGTSTTSTPAPTLPQSGTDWPTIAGFGIGVLVIFGSLLLAL